MKNTFTIVSISLVLSLAFVLVILLRAYSDLSGQNTKLQQRATWLESKNAYLDWRVSNASGFNVPAENYTTD